MDNLQLLYSNNCGDNTYLVLFPTYAESETGTNYLRPGQIVCVLADSQVFFHSVPKMWAVA